MSDEVLCKALRQGSLSKDDYRYEAADRIEALTAERDEYWKSFVHWRKEADALTEQLKAARSTLAEIELVSKEGEQP
jgi:uncharacterized coiled-coil DUF342 family protein